MMLSRVEYATRELDEIDVIGFDFFAWSENPSEAKFRERPIRLKRAGHFLPRKVRVVLKSFLF